MVQKKEPKKEVKKEIRKEEKVELAEAVVDAGSCTYAGKDTAEIQCSTDNGVSEREEQYHDIR